MIVRILTDKTWVKSVEHNKKKVKFIFILMQPIKNTTYIVLKFLKTNLNIEIGFVLNQLIYSVFIKKITHYIPINDFLSAYVVYITSRKLST